MKAGNGALLSALFVGAAIIAVAVGSHYLVGLNAAGSWVAWINFGQHVGFNGIMAVVFGRTLLPGRDPLVTDLARLIHEHMTPVLLRYTRQVTVAWTLFFLGSAVVSMLLFVMAPIEAWSMFANILSLPLVGLMFVVENEVRKRVLPPEDRVGIVATFRAFRAAMKS
jgi:uncharacterized membrane protein